MTAETERNPSGWTVDTLKAYVDALRESDQRALTLLNDGQRLAQAEFAGTVAARFVQINEFRQALTDLSQNMATRRELESAATISSSRLEAIQKQLADHQSRLDVGPSGLAALATQQATETGRQKGTQQLTANTYGFLVALAAIAGVIGHYLH